jgi:hypothetical protein
MKKIFLFISRSAKAVFKIAPYLFNDHLYRADHFKMIWADLKNIRAKEEPHRDHAITAALHWLEKAQFYHGGFSAGYSFAKGWLPPYPETTGYFIPTLFSAEDILSQDHFREIALKASRWHCSIQHKDGWFPSKYLMAHQPLKPSIFNTGQIIQGLFRSYCKTHEDLFFHSALLASRWIISQQEESSCWRRWSYNNIPHSYYARVSWPLIELGQAAQDERLLHAAEKTWIGPFNANTKTAGSVKTDSLIMKNL